MSHKATSPQVSPDSDVHPVRVTGLGEGYVGIKQPPLWDGTPTEDSSGDFPRTASQMLGHRSRSIWFLHELRKYLEAGEQWALPASSALYAAGAQLISNSLIRCALGTSSFIAKACEPLITSRIFMN